MTKNKTSLVTQEIADYQFIRDQIQEHSDLIKQKKDLLKINQALLKYKIRVVEDIERVNCDHNEKAFLAQKKDIILDILVETIIRFHVYQNVLNLEKFETKKVQQVMEQVYSSIQENLITKYLESIKLAQQQCNGTIRLDISQHGKIPSKVFDEQFSNNIKLLEADINTKSKLLAALKGELQSHSPRLIKTPNHVYTHTKGIKKKEEMNNFFKKNDSLEVIKLMFKVSDPETYQILEQDLEPENKKAAIINYIEQNPEKIIEYIVGAKLEQKEDMIFSALRVLAIRAFQAGEAKSYDTKITVKASELWKLCNLTLDSSGYDSKQKAEIKELLKKDEKLQTKRMYESGESYSVTSFVLNVWWNKSHTVAFQMDSIFFFDENNLSYFYEDIEGRNRVLSAMPKRNKYAYKLHKYFCHGFKKKKQSFNVSTLLEESGLMKKYEDRREKNDALNHLQKILDVMYEQKTIVGNKPVITPSKSDPLGKYDLIDIRRKEIQELEQQK